MIPRRDQLVNLLRQRILRDLETGRLQRGGRLPSTRTVAAEYRADPRVALAAYRRLASEGLVELRERSGIFVAQDATTDGRGPALPEQWLVDVLADAVGRDVPALALADRIREAVATVRLRVGVVAATEDQMAGICRELRDDYGVDASGVVDPPSGAPEAWPIELRDADVLVTTDAYAGPVRAAGEALGIPVVVLEVRADLIGREWLALLAGPVYVVVTDPRFHETLRGFFRGVRGEGNVRPVVLGRDDPSAIPADAVVYVTQSARERLDGVVLPGRVVPTARTFAARTSRELLAHVVAANRRGARRRAPEAAGPQRPAASAAGLSSPASPDT